MDIFKLKTDLTAASQELAAAKTKIQENPDDANAIKELNEASAKVIDLSGQYTRALEESKPLDKDIDTLIRQAKESTRQEEKDKLYAQIEKAKKERDDLKAQMDQKVQEALEEHKRQLQLADGDGEGEGSGGEELTQETIDKILDTKLKALQEQHAKALQEASKKSESEMAVLRKELEVKELNEYKREAIAQAGDQIIPDMINGNTREEIDASIVKAKQAYEKVANSVARRQQDRRGGLPTAPTAGNDDDSLPGDGPTAEEISRMSIDEYMAWKKTPEGRRYLGG